MAGFCDCEPGFVLTCFDSFGGSFVLALRCDFAGPVVADLRAGRRDGFTGAIEIDRILSVQSWKKTWDRYQEWEDLSSVEHSRLSVTKLNRAPKAQSKKVSKNDEHVLHNSRSDPPQQLNYVSMTYLWAFKFWSASRNMSTDLT